MKAALSVTSGLTDKREYPLEEGKAYLLGRSREAQVIIKDRLASRNHCRITMTGPDEWTIADLGSSNGTYVNRQRVTTRTLRHGDVIQIGKTTLEFRVLSATTAPTVVTPQTSGQAQKPQPQGAAGAPAQPPPPQAAAAPAPPPKPPAAAAQPHKPPPAPAQTPKAPPAEPPPQQAPPPPKQAPVDEDIRGLFEFLDQVEKSERSAPATPQKKHADEPILPPLDETPAAQEHEPPSKPEDKKSDTAGAPLFSLLDDRAAPATPPAPPKPAQPPPPPPAEKQGGGGLLAFLRKKKQQQKQQ